MARVPRLRSCPSQHQVADVAALLLHVLGGVDQHPAGPGRGVADAHPLLRLQQLYDEAHHLAGRVELAALLAGVVGELVDQVLVGVAQHVAGVYLAVAQVGVAEVQAGEVVEELADKALPVGRAAQLLLVVPVDPGEHPVQPARCWCPRRRWLATFSASPRPMDCAGDNGPASVLRHEELVLVGVGEGRLAAARPGR